MINIKKIFVPFIIIFVFFTINIQNSFALTKAIFPTLNPPQPKPANIRPNISKDINDTKDNFIYVNKEGNYEAPNINDETVDSNTESVPTLKTNNKNVSLVFFVIIIIIIPILLFFLYKKFIAKKGF